MLLTYKNHKPLRYKSQVKQQVSEASGSILVVDVVEPDLHDLDLRMLHRRHGKLPVLRARAMPIRPASVTIITSFFIVCPFCRFSSVSWLSATILSVKAQAYLSSFDVSFCTMFSFIQMLLPKPDCQSRRIQIQSQNKWFFHPGTTVLLICSKSRSPVR